MAFDFLFTETSKEFSCLGSVRLAMRGRGSAFVSLYSIY